MKYLIFLAMAPLLLSCTEEVDIFPPENSIDGIPSQSTTSISMIGVDDVKSYKDLEHYLRGKYGDIQLLDSIWSSAGSGDTSSGPFRFRLPDSSEISIDGLYDRVNGQTVDPNFDLLALPELESYRSN